MAILLFMNVVAGLSAFTLSYGLIRFSNFADSLSCLFVLYLGQIIATELILGIFGALYLKNLILLNTAILLVILYIGRRKELGLFTGIKDNLLDLFNNKVILFGASLILGFGIVKVLINLVNPPFGWDSLSYHFVFPVEWLKHGNLDTPITICDDPSPPYYPINGSLFFLWFMLPLRNVFLADLGQLPFFILAFISIYSISRKLDVGREFSIYAAALFIITPNIFKQVEIAYIDVMIAALFLAGINFLLGFYKDFSLNNLILWSLCFAIFLGTKTSAIIYGIFPCLFFCIALLKNINKQRLIKVIGFFALFIVITLAWGGFSYIRNFINTGNPLYPAQITFLGHLFLKGVVPFSTYRAHWTNSDFNLFKLLFCEGMGGQFILFVLPAMILSIPFIFMEARKNKRPQILFILSLPVFLYVSFLLFMPQFWVRYLYPFVGAGFIVAAYIYSRLNFHKTALKWIVAACFLGSAAELSGHWELFASLMLSLLFLVAIRAVLRVRFGLRLAIAICVVLILTLRYLNHNYNQNEFTRYISNCPFPNEDALAWKWLNDNTGGVKIAYAGVPHVLALYGAKFKNDALYVSVNKTHPVKLHYFPAALYTWNNDYMAFHKGLEENNNYRQAPVYTNWLKNLRQSKIDYLVVYSLHAIEDRVVFPLEDEWALKHPENFSVAYKNNTVHIYKLIR